MTKSIIYCILFLGVFSASGQENILKLSSDKHYKIYFVYVRLIDDEQSDTIRNQFTVTWDNEKSFLMDDKTVIDKFQNDWKGKKSNDFYFCWYDYFLYVVEEGKIVDEIRVNEECKTVVCKHGIFNYTTPILESLDKSKLISVARVRFDSVSTGRLFIKDANANPEIYVPAGEYDEWIKYDGRVAITTKDGDDEKIKANIRKAILKKFPSADLLIYRNGGGLGLSDYDIYCTEEVGKNLSYFKIFMEWRALEPSDILIMSNLSASISELLKKYGR
jgi:hypothetical protein